LQWIQTRQGEATLHDKAPDSALSPPYLHSRYSIERELDTWLENLDWQKLSQRVQVLYCFGLGLGELFDRLEPWLLEAPDRYLVFLEDDLRVWRRFLESERAERVLRNRQVLFFHPGDNEGEVDLVAEELAYYFVQLPIAVTALPAYQKSREERHCYLQMRLMHQAAYVSYGSDEFLRYGGSFFQNYYSNLNWLPEACRPGALFGRFPKVPAIICGAGPSLNQNIDLLATLEKRALIFAGGSAMNALTNRGIIPHFGASVDPNYEQVKRIATQSNFSVPFFFKGRAHHQVMSLVHGPKIYLAGNSGYPVSSWIERKLGIEEALISEGHNVLHMTMDIARLMGCDPIIFVGMDLAYTGMQQYAGSVVSQPQMDEKGLTAASDLNNNSFIRSDIYGNPVYTLWKWVAEANYTAKYVQGHSDTTFINATEGGLGVEGVENQSLQEVFEQYLQTDRDLRGAIHTLLEQSRYTLSRDAIDTVLEFMKKSVEDSQGLCEELASCFTELKEAILSKEFSRVEVLSLEIEEKQLALGREEAMAQILGPVNHIRSILFERQLAETGGGEQTDEERISAHCDANREEMESLAEAARKNIEAMAKKKAH
jgi:hypothetical protein